VTERQRFALTIGVILGVTLVTVAAMTACAIAVFEGASFIWLAGVPSGALIGALAIAVVWEHWLDG
jgi:hypothetical protein